MRLAALLRGLASAGLLGAVASCQNLPELTPDVCGNGVLDPGEDCDDIATSTRCGAPSTATACRFVCTFEKTADSSATKIACPDGFRCGADSICRQADDTFTVGQQSVAVGADRTVAADLGGTGVASIIAVSRDILDLGYPRILDFDSGGLLTADQTVEGSFGIGGVGDANGDGLDDVVFSRLDGLLLTVGVDATTVAAVSSDAIALPERARVKLVAAPGSSSLAPSAGRTSELLGFVSNLQAEGRDPDHTYVINRDPKFTVGELDFPVSAFTDRSTSLPDPQYRCERVVVARHDSRQILSLQPCCPIIPPVGGSERTVCSNENARLLEGTRGMLDVLAETTNPIKFGPWSLDVDGDGRTDIVVATAAPEANGRVALEVAFGGEQLPGTIEGDASRALYSAPPSDTTPATGIRHTALLTLRGRDVDGGLKAVLLSTPFDIAAETRTLEEIDPATNQTVRVVRRFVTFVDGSSVQHAEYVPTPTTNTEGPSLNITGGLTRTSPWTSACLTSFRGDGNLDLVGGRTRAVDLDVALGTTDLTYNLNSVRTGLSTDRLALADVDGDRTTDVVLSSDVGPTSQLSALFGRRDGFPAELVSLGSYDRIVQIVAAPLALGLLGADSAADVALVTRSGQGDAATDAVTVLRSVGGRLPFSLYGLAADATDGSTRIEAAPVASAIVHRPGAADVVALGADIRGSLDEPTSYQLWSGAVDRGSRLRLTAPHVGPILAVQALLDGEDSDDDAGFNAMLRAVDLDDDGSEEVIGVSASSDRTVPVLFVGKHSADGYQLSLPPTAIESPRTRTGDPYLRVFALESVDIDGDGDRDVVVLLASAPDFERTQATDFYDLAARDTVVLVVPNDGGQLVPARASVVVPPAKVYALAVGTVGNRTAPSLVFLTDDGVAQAARQDIYLLENGSFAAPQFTALYSNPSDGTQGPRPLAGARSLLVTDVTGDGIADLVVGGRERLTVLRAGTKNR